jgi:hypothetical protein
MKTRREKAIDAILKQKERFKRLPAKRCAARACTVFAWMSAVRNDAPEWH